MTSQRRLLLVAGAGVCLASTLVFGHEGHQATTYQVSPSWTAAPAQRQLRLSITDEAGQPLAARFTLTIDGKPYIPQQLGQHGLRFVSIHKGKRNTFVATYARGSGVVTIGLPPATQGEVSAARGFEYRMATGSFRINEGVSNCSLVLRRWIDLSRQGWQAADEHVHYERVDKQHDADWLTMLRADGLAHAHFLVLKGGNVPGVWAQQYGYGVSGEAQDGKQFIRSGEEYRDGAQGHINLLGIDEVIQPISTGRGDAPYNYPPLLDVFREAHRRGGIGGPAHGAALAKSSTAVLDTVLGEVDFFEIANSHLYKTDMWYLLMNCGFVVPPVAGTDLPNFGYRDRWQPLLGEVRTYVRAGEKTGFAAWAKALGRGEVFVTSGPILQFSVDGRPPGSIIRLPDGGGEVTLFAELSSPRPLESLEFVQMGRVIADRPTRSTSDGIHRWVLRQSIKIEESCWIAARGTGGPKRAIEQGLKIRQNEMAHTAAIQVLVGDRQIGSAEHLEIVRQQLATGQQFYRTEARYGQAEHRRQFLELFDQAEQVLQKR